MGKRRQILLLFLALTTGALLAGGGAYCLWGRPESTPPVIKNVIRKIAPFRSSMRSENSKNTTVYLYFGNKTDTLLIAEERTLFHSDSPTGLSEAIINALIDGPQKDLGRTIPVETKLNAVYLTDSGRAYVDLSEDVRNRHPGGSQLEYLTIYSIVNSLVLNVSQIKEVQLLIGGKEEQTLSGHIVFNAPFAANMYLIR